jgi:DNA-binding response OmpR family regulator
MNGEWRMENGEFKRAALLLSDDLLFTSRITGAAQANGVAIKVARSVEVLKNLAKSEKPILLLVDLSNPGLVIEELLDWVRTFAIDQQPRVIAYGSHVDTETLRAARAAGCDEVMPRSQFVERLQRQFTEWAATKA